MIQHCVRDNLAAIDQGIALLNGLDAAGYTRRAPECFNSSAGGHLRHAVEHYRSFLLGLESGEVDYEARPRDGLIERDPAYAAGQLEAIKRELEVFARENADRPLRVRAETAPEGAVSPWAGSTAWRELEFLLSHTVHHYALIAVVCRLTGAEVPGDFGMAPSTLRYLENTRKAAACAR